MITVREFLYQYVSTNTHIKVMTTNELFKPNQFIEGSCKELADNKILDNYIFDMLSLNNNILVIDSHSLCMLD